MAQSCRTFRTLFFRTTALLLPVFTIPASAQTLAAAEIPRVDVVGIAPVYGMGVARDLLPYPVQAATDRTMHQAGGENVTEFMVRHLNGVNTNEVSGSPFQNDITFRGFRASPVLGSAQGLSVYIDGVRINEPFGDVINWDMLPEAAIADIALMPGANPLFGLNTLGGALAFTTKSGLTHPGGEAELSLTNAGRRRADLAYGWHGQNGWHSFVAGTWFDDTGWRDHSAGHLANVFVKVGRAQGATDWSATLLGGRSRLLGNGLLPESIYDDDRRAVYTYRDTTRNRVVQGTLNLTHRFDADSELTAVAYARNSHRATVNGDVSDAYGDYVEDCGAGFDRPGCDLSLAEGAALHPGVLNTTRTRQHGQGASIAFGTRHGAYRIDAGATIDVSHSDYAQYEQDAFMTPDRDVIGDPDAPSTLSSAVSGAARTYGIYAAAGIALSTTTQLTASARYNRARVTNTLSDEDGNQPTERFTYTHLNPALGVTHRLGSGATVFANIAQSNRVPTVIELGCADPDNPCRLPVGLQSDPYLKQVVARTMEAGIRGQLPGTNATDSYTVSLHRTVNRDDILFFSSPSRQGYFANVDRTRHQGMDALLTRQAGAFGIRLGYSYLQAIYDADAQLFTGARHVTVGRGTPIAGLPRHTGKLGLDWTPDARLRLGADLHAVSSLVTQGNEDGSIADAEPGAAPQRADWRIGGHALLTLRLRYQLAANLDLFARVNNVFDRRYETFGAIAPDLFPHGELIKPHEDTGDADNARFVAPGAPRTLVAGLRYTF